MAPHGDAIGLYIKIVGKIRAAESDNNSFTYLLYNRYYKFATVALISENFLEPISIPAMAVIRKCLMK